MNLLPGKRLFIMGALYYPTSKNKTCVYLLIIKIFDSYDSEKCTASCHVLNLPFKEQKSTLMFCGGDGTDCFAKNTKRDYDK